MYKTLLTWRYFCRKRVAWLAVAAVALVVMMTLIVLSVMAGLLQDTRQRNHDWAGDLVLTRDSLVGFAGYQAFLPRLRSLPEVEAATPVIHTFALLAPNPAEAVVYGIHLEEFCHVTQFQSSLHLLKDEPSPSFLYGRGMPRPSSDQAGPPHPGFIAGSYLLGAQYLAETSHDAADAVRSWARHTQLPPITLTVFGLSPRGTLAGSGLGEQRRFTYVDDSDTGLVDVDTRALYVDFDQLAELTYMNEPEGLERTSEIRIRLAPNANPSRARNAIQAAWNQFLSDLEAAPTDFPPISPARIDMIRQLGRDVRAQSWTDYRRTNIAPAQREKTLMMVVFGMIGAVVVFILFAIFYLIVTEKHKDIGIAKSLGATSWGVSSLFLQYGALVGLAGAFLGTFFGSLIVLKSNEIATALGITIWDPRVYAIDRIPDTVDPVQAGMIALAAVVACVLGAAIPARRAARLNPVQTLRAE